MTVIQFARNLIRSRWQVSHPDRPNNVPVPEFLLEADPDKVQVSIADTDLITVQDGAPVNYEPVGVGWKAQNVDLVVNYDIRTTVSRERMFGYRLREKDGLGDPEPHGGLIGEVKRILDTARTGEKEYDLITASQFNDLSGEVGGGIWRGQFVVRFEQRAASIGVDPR